MSLEYRAECLAKARSFFAERGVIEVDTNVLSPYAPIDQHIDVMKVDTGNGPGGHQVGYLHTSPEYAMKKLLAQGAPDIYQLGHVFRAGEESPIHSPEFTMLEWYRIGAEYDAFIDETLNLIRLFLGDLPKEILSYRDALQKFAGVDLDSDLHEAHAIEPASHEWDRDTKLDLLFTHLVEPNLGKGVLTVITEYPASQAALAKKHLVDGREVARRFEVYCEGIEYANGYDELTDPVEQRARLIEEDEARIAMGKESLPIDEEFIEALGSMPECCGVAVGFDRLVISSRGRLESAVLH